VQNVLQTMSIFDLLIYNTTTIHPAYKEGEILPPRLPKNLGQTYLNLHTILETLDIFPTITHNTLFKLYAV